MNSSDAIREAIAAFESVTLVSSGDPVTDPSDSKYTEAGWVKFVLEKSELGWRTLEFLAWVCDDMVRAGERLKLFPISPPPYLNEPGKCLSFVIECYPVDGDKERRFAKVAEFITWCRKAHWADCRPCDREM